MPGPCDHSWHVRTRGERSRPRAPCRTRTPPARRRGYLPRLRDLGSGSEAHSMAHGATIRTGLIGYGLAGRSEEHTSELQSLMRISYAVFCLKKKKSKIQSTNLTS